MSKFGSAKRRGGAPRALDMLVRTLAMLALAAGLYAAAVASWILADPASFDRFARTALATLDPGPAPDRFVVATVPVPEFPGAARVTTAAAE